MAGTHYGAMWSSVSMEKRVAEWMKIIHVLGDSPYMKTLHRRVVLLEYVTTYVLIVKWCWTDTQTPRDVYELCLEPKLLVQKSWYSAAIVNLIRRRLGLVVFITTTLILSSCSQVDNDRCGMLWGSMWVTQHTAVWHAMQNSRFPFEESSKPLESRIPVSY